jgi:hypothetical protein
MIIVHCQADLLEVISATGTTSGFTSHLDGRKQQGDQYGTDRDYYQEFDQGKPPITPC